MNRPERGTRPRNRRRLILEAATALFARDGYSRVAMSDVAEAVAIGPSALYRHFPGKQQMLADGLLDSFGRVRSIVEHHGDDPLPSFARAMLENRALGVLWQREARHLEPDRRESLRAEVNAIAEIFTEFVHRHRADLTDDQARLLGWAVMGAGMSVANQRVRLPDDEYDLLLTGILESITRTELPLVSPGRPPLPERDEPRPTRDALLSAAVRLFAERGYRSVSTDEIGAAAGIAGPSMYHHFPAKSDLLAEAMARGAEHLDAALNTTMTREIDAAKSLRGIVVSYVDYTLANHHAFDLLITETGHLPAPDQDRILRLQREYTTTWLDLAVEVHPALPRSHARVQVQAVLTLTNDVARTTRLREIPGVDAMLAAVGAGVLLG